MTWQPVTYDPELNLIYVTTGNPQPVIAGKARAGDNLFTESIVTLNPDTGKMAWYFQPSPHDTHDWDATQTPVWFDGEINGHVTGHRLQGPADSDPAKMPQLDGALVTPNQGSAANWPPPSYNPDTGLFTSTLPGLSGGYYIYDPRWSHSGKRQRPFRRFEHGRQGAVRGRRLQ